MTIWRHSLIRRCLLSHPHFLHHPIDLITRSVYTWHRQTARLTIEKRPGSYCMFYRKHRKWRMGRRRSFWMEFFCMLWRGSGTNPYVISVTALVKKIGKEGPMPYIFWRLIFFCLFPSHRHRHHSCRMPFFAPLLPFHFEGGATLLIRWVSWGSWFCIIALSAGGAFSWIYIPYIVILYIHGTRRKLSWFQGILFITGGLLDDSL